MRRALLSFVVAVPVAVVAACGSTPTSTFVPDSGTHPDGGGVDATVDAPVILPGDGGPQTCGDGQALVDGSCETCASIDVKVQTQASCSLSILNGFTMDGEGFITVQNQTHRIFAIDRYGTGHMIAWCDGTTNADLIKAFDVRGYLSQKKTPKLASFGYGVLCQAPYVPADFTYLGQDLPVKYQNNAAGLAADWDAIVFCGFGIPWSWDWSQVLSDFASVHGKGILLSMDYFGPPGLATSSDFDKMNLIANKAGVSFDKVKLDWAQASLSISLSCVPDVPLPPK